MVNDLRKNIIIGIVKIEEIAKILLNGYHKNSILLNAKQKVRICLSKIFVTFISSAKNNLNLPRESG